MSWALRLLRDLADQLKDNEDPSTTSLFNCGVKTLEDLRLAAQDLAITERSPQQSCETLEALMQISYGNMSSKISGVPSVCWRRLYTDACFLRSLADVSNDIPSQSIILESIARLDRAIIISGAPGEGRLDLILHVIRKIQTDYLDPLPCDLVHRFLSSPRLPIDLATSSKQVPIIAPPSFSAFQNHLCQRPFILQGFAHDWPAMTEHPWSSLDYLRSVAGPGRLVPIEVGKDYRKDDWTQRLMNWDEFLDALDFSDRAQSPIEAGQPVQEREILYLAQHNLLKQFPALRSDIIVPDYVYASLSPPGYEPPGNEEQLVLNAWLGPKGTVSPAHTDPYFNFYVQVVGRKTIWLAPPNVSPSMYPYPSSSVDPSLNPAVNTINPSMSNTSRVDVFSEESALSREEYPAFWEDVVPDAYSITMEAGDLLFFPPGWWHAMRSEETSFSVSMWF